MFHAIRQNGSGSAFVLIRMLDVLTKVAEAERSTDRLGEVGRHADLVVAAGERELGDGDAVADLKKRLEIFRAAVGGLPADGGARPPPAADVHS